MLAVTNLFIDSNGRSGTFDKTTAENITNDLILCETLAKQNTNFVSNISYWALSPTMDTKFESIYRKCLHQERTFNFKLGDNMRRRTNNTPEEINQSILALVNEWNISDEHNEVVATHVIGLQLKKIRLVRRLTQTKIARSVGCTFQQIQKV